MIPARNVRTIHGESCGNRTITYKTENTTSGDIALYFYPLAVDTDTTMTQVALQASVAKDDQLKLINETINKGTKVGPLNAAFDETIKEPVVLASAFPSTASVGTTSINVTSLSLNVASVGTSGFIFAGIAPGSAATPTARDIRIAASGNSTGIFSQPIQILYYNPSSGAVSVNFVGLSQGTAYKIFLAGSNNDPSNTAIWTTTPVTAISATTTNTTTPAAPISAITLATSLLVALISALSILLI
jgi:hypothetical protein